MLSDYPQVLKSLQTQMEAMKRQEERLTKPIAPEEFAKMSAPDAPAFGPKDAKVTIVEFSDFQCPYCSRAANAVHSLKEKYSDKVHFVFRQFPLVSIHPNAQGAAEASLAAHAQNKFWEFHDKLFANQQQLTREALEGYAKELGLNVADFKKALDDKKFAPAVEAEVKLGTANSVDGTPTMFLNGKRVADPTNVAEISKQIDEALKS
jgi:protein-disulfide isomerase